MKKCKAMIVSTSRADYGLLSPLIGRIAVEESFTLQLIATGSHLSATHGETLRNISEDGYPVDTLVDMLPPNDTDDGVCTSISQGLKGFSTCLVEYAPDFVIVLGDRYELLSVCIAALIHKIPIVHIHGGESTIGAIDESIRHAITKMASVHFPSIPQYGNRIIQLGENPERVHVVGALGIDNISNIKRMTCEELSQRTGVDFSRDVALMTYHPVTLDDGRNATSQVKEVLEALLGTGLVTLMTAPNIDAGGESILWVMEFYVQQNPTRFVLVRNLGQQAYLSAMDHARLMIGNSSSGIIESASFRLPVVNIGDRQEGRFKSANVIDCVCKRDDIIIAITKALSDDFRKKIAFLVNPYGDGNTAQRIVDILKGIDFENKTALIKKRFHDILSTDPIQQERMEPVVLIGAGGHAEVVLDTIRKYHHEYQVIGVIEKNADDAGGQFFGFPILGSDDVLAVLHEKGIQKAVIGLGMIRNGQSRKDVCQRVRDKGISLVNVIHGSSVLSDTVVMGQGNVILAGCIINTNVRIGNDCILNTGCIIEHGTTIGTNVHIAPGAVLLGQVVVEDNCFIGANSTILQGVHIGENSVIGASSVVLRDLPSDSFVAGVPARNINHE